MERLGGSEDWYDYTQRNLLTRFAPPSMKGVSAECSAWRSCLLALAVVAILMGLLRAVAGSVGMVGIPTYW
jgi:hypothetical protein